MIPRTHDKSLRLIPGQSELMRDYVLTTPKRAPSSMISEAQRAAQLIYQNAKQEILLPFSGGIDSEAMVESFRKEAIPFTALIFDYNGFNEFDIGFAKRYCARHSIPTKIVTVDLERFFLSQEHLEIAREFECRSPQLAVHLHAIKKVEGFVVFPHNPIALYNRGSHFYWEFPQNLYLSFDRFFAKTGRGGVGLFFLYTPELIYSYVTLPIYRELLTRPRRHWTIFSRDPYLIKCELFRQGGFDAQPKPAKATGFEKFRIHLNQQNKGRYQHDYFDEQYRRPMEEITNDLKIRFTGSIDLKYLYSHWQEADCREGSK